MPGAVALIVTVPLAWAVRRPSRVTWPVMICAGVLPLTVAIWLAVVSW